MTAGRVPADAEAFDRLFDRPEQPFVEPNALFIEGIEIIGNNKTLRSVIERRILVQPKDLLNEDRIEESRLRLLNTGFFKSVDVSLRRGSRPGQILLVIEVEERNTVLIDQIYMGFSSVSPVFGGIGIAETNFLGRGVTVGGSMVIGQDRRGAEARLFVPYLSDTALQLSASAIFVQGAEAIDDRNPMELQLFYDRWGGSLGLGVGVGPSQRVSLIYRLESVRASNLRALMPSVVRRAPSILTDESVLSTLALTYERDTRDDPFVPSQGTRLALAVEAGTTLLGSSYEFSKYTGEAQHALSIIDGHSVIIRGFGGLIQGETPFFNQFFISDFAYFAWNRDSLRRKGQINFSESNDYDDLIFHVGVDYNIRMFSGDDVLYRMFVYGGVDLTFTASLDEIQEDPSGRGTGNNAPVSFDIGLKFDTSIGNFAFSLAYVLDLVY
ncbi:MAG: BamA/TamA family outer membrane protein [Myxococcota bacterium]